MQLIGQAMPRLEDLCLAHANLSDIEHCISEDSNLSDIRYKKFVSQFAAAGFIGLSISIVGDTDTTLWWTAKIGVACTKQQFHQNNQYNNSNKC